MTKTLEQVSAALAERYAGTIKEIDGNSYVPWNLSLKQAIDVFGADGFDVAVNQVQKIGEGFMAVVTITAYTTDGRSFSRSNVGYSDIKVTKAGRELIDTAIKTAVSDGISRTLKLFGDAFALFLYDKADPANQTAGTTDRAHAEGRTTTTSTPRAQTGGDGLGPRPSGPQMFHLKKIGYTDDSIQTVPFNEWKAALDEYFEAKKQKPVLAAVKTPADYADDEDDI